MSDDAREAAWRMYTDGMTPEAINEVRRIASRPVTTSHELTIIHPMKSPSDIVGATCFVFQPPGIESDNGVVNPKWEFHMRHGDNPAFRWAHLLMPGAVRTGRTVEVMGDIEVWGVPVEELPEVDGGRFHKCILPILPCPFTTYIWARNRDELLAMCRHIGLLVPCGPSNDVYLVPTRWQRIKCVLRYFWLRRPTIKLRSPVTP